MLRSQLRLTFILFLTILASRAGADALLPPNPSAGGWFGYTVAGTPDLDGDGFGDALVGAHNEPVNGIVEAGRVHVYSGATGEWIRTLVSPSPQADGSFGISVSAVPDTTGDGIPEIVIGAYKETGAGSPAFAGRAYLFNGATGELLLVLKSPYEQNAGSFGWEVTGMADVNDDGYGEIAVGAFTEDPASGPVDAGRVYIFDGVTGNLIWELDSPVPDAEGYFGYALSGMTDSDGDGKGDLIVGAYQEDVSGLENAGRAYLFSGATGDWLWAYWAPASLRVNDGRFGFSVSRVPDVDDDGLEDVLIGACCEVSPGFSVRTGNAYLITGNTGLLWNFYTSPTPDSSGQFGFSVAGVPDIDGDGYGDAIIGAIRENPPGTPGDSGRAYIYSTSSFTGPLLHGLSSPNRETAGYFGCSVGALPDAGGDFRGDVVVGAYQEDPGVAPNDSGRAYIFDGLTGTLKLHRNSVRNWRLYR